MTTATKTEKPILFSTELVQAILDGRKTQTRRVIKPQPRVNEVGNFCFDGEMYPHDLRGNHIFKHFIKDHCPYDAEELWVRESFYHHKELDSWRPSEIAKSLPHCRPVYETDELTKEQRSKIGKKRPSIHMPREDSRIQLTVEDIRVERVQEIDGMDAFAEGIGEELPMGNNGIVKRELYREKFAELWDSINAGRNDGKYSWDKNPFVWVVNFNVKNVKQ